MYFGGGIGKGVRVISEKGPLTNAININERTRVWLVHLGQYWRAGHWQFGYLTS